MRATWRSTVMHEAVARTRTAVWRHGMPSCAAPRLPYWHVSCGGLQALAPWDTIPAARVCRARDIELAHMLRESPVGGSYPYARTEDSRGSARPAAANLKGSPRTGIADSPVPLVAAAVAKGYAAGHRKSV